MKILISITNLAIGGAQTFIARLATSLSASHSVYIYNLSPDAAKDTIIDRLPDNIKIISFSLPSLVQRLLWKLDRLALKFGLKVTISEELRRLHFRVVLALLKIDIVNSHLYHSDNFVVMQSSTTPVVITDHGDYRYVVQEKIGSLDTVLKIFSRASGIIYVSDSNAAALSKYVENSLAFMKKIYYGVTPSVQSSYPISGRQKLGIPEDALVLGMVARGIPDKGWAEALQAFAIIQSLAERDIHMIIVGESDYLTSLKQSLDENLSSIVHFVGYSSEPNYWIESFDIGLLPTYFPGESLPNSVIEYLSLGKPVIATEVGGIPEMITHNNETAGFIINLSQDGKADISMMADVMLGYINDPRLLEKHSYLAKQAFEKFNMQTCIDSYESFFQEILSQDINLDKSVV